MPSFDEWTSAYLCLEERVRDLMNEHCAPTCAVCRRVCCKEHFCHESLDSTYLVRARALVEPPEYSANSGWLGPHGCRLPGARPPVCYEFVCSRILEDLSPAKRHALLVAGSIVPFLGNHAVGKWHLVELDDEMMPDFDPEKEWWRLSVAEAALDAARTVLSEGEPTADGIEAMERVAHG